MAKLTITLPDSAHQALQEEAARRDTTIDALIVESIEHCGIKTELTAAEIVEQARATAGMTEAEALKLAVRETRAVRAEASRRATRR